MESVPLGGSRSRLVLSAVTALAFVSAGSGGLHAASDSTTPDTAGGAGDALEAARAEVEALMVAPTEIGVTEPLEVRPEGELFIQMRCAAPICVEATEAYSAAAAAVGMEFRAIDTGATPTEIASAYSLAVEERPAALISGAVPTELWSSQLEDLVANGTKVILYATIPPESPEVAAVIYDQEEFAKIGRQMANFVAVDANGEPANILYVEVPEFTALTISVTAFQEQIGMVCPDCSVGTINVQAADIGTAIPGEIVSYLQANPDTEYVVAQFGDILVGVPQALEAAGIESRKLITSQGSSVNMQYIEQGQEYADVINYLDLTYWQAVDVAARAVTDQPFEIPPVQTRWVTQENLDWDPEDPPPFGTDYEAEFRKLWE